jgi:hypothetical protein
MCNGFPALLVIFSSDHLHTYLALSAPAKSSDIRQYKTTVYDTLVAGSSGGSNILYMSSGFFLKGRNA